MRVSVEPFFQLSLLGLVSSGYLAVAGSGHLDLPTIALTAAGLLLRAALVTGLIRLTIPERAVTALTIAYIGFYPLDYRFVSGDFLAATVHLVFFLAVLKILTARTERDYLYTAAISLVELLAAALISVQLNFFLFLGLYLLFAVAALTSGEIRRSTAQAGHIARRGPRRRVSPRLAALAGFVTLGVLALTAVLFFVLPRTASAALRQLASKGYYLPGFSNEVTLGRVGEIKMRTSPVMHVRFDTKDGRFETRWRGAALTEFDGRRWYNRPAIGETLRVGPGRMVVLAADRQRRRSGRRFSYHVNLKPFDTDSLFFAGTPEFLFINARTVSRLETGGFRLGLGPSEGLRYDVHSYVEDERTTIAEATEDQLPDALSYLRLPPLDGRVPRLAREWAGRQATDAARAYAIEQRLRRDFGYTLEQPQTAPADPLAHFLFERRKGHCEYFASAMAVMLRVLNIPSRMATGFLGGTYNPVSELYVVRASDAHTWVEAFLPGRGWTMFDPTPPDPNPARPTLLTRLAFYVDAAETFWQEWVVSYDLGRQLVLADRMEQSSRRLRLDWLARWTTPAAAWSARGRDLALRHWPVALLLVAALAGAAWFGPAMWRTLRIRAFTRRVRQGQATMADATVLYRRFLELLERRGYTKPPWLTAGELARSVRDAEAAQLAGRFAVAYHALRFGGKLDAAPRLTALLDEMESR
ncbi:MAG: transglutaminase TgpA family protein [Bryobacteraceae bacterium]